MKQIFFVILYLLGTNIQPQSLNHTKLNCVVLINPDYGGDINIYDTNGKVIKILKNKIKEQDYISLTIINKNDSMYNVIVRYLLGTDTIKGWIRKDNPEIGIYSKPCGAPPINLYETPQEKSKIKSTITTYNNYLHVKDCENNWLFISIVISNKTYEGWMSPDVQCSNPYSGCCGN